MHTHAHTYRCTCAHAKHSSQQTHKHPCDMHVHTQRLERLCFRRESHRHSLCRVQVVFAAEHDTEAHTCCDLRGHKTEVLLGQRKLGSGGEGMRKGLRVRRREGQGGPSCRPHGLLPEFTPGRPGRRASVPPWGPCPQQPRGSQAAWARGHLPIPQGQRPPGLGKATVLRPSGPTSWATAICPAS